jgi:ribosome-binding ATPase YchF (GTP1/OBG family)
MIRPFLQPEEKNEFSFIQNSEAVLAVVRASRDALVPGQRSLHTVKQLETIETELLVRDMEVVETGSQIKKQKRNENFQQKRKER